MEKTARLGKYLGSHPVILLAYSLLTVVFTYPLAFRIGSALPGIAPDTAQYCWNIDWVRRALFEYGTNPDFTPLIYYPTGVSLAFHTLVLGNDFLTLPLQFAIGLAPAYMVMTLATFVMGGYGAYLLAFELLRHRGAAFFAGLVFTFAPYHLAHLLYGHFNLITVQWLPLFALAAKKFYDRPSGKHFLLALVILVWTSLTEWYYALDVLIFFGIYTLYRVLRDRAWRMLGVSALMGVIYLALMSPLLIPMLNETSSWPGTLRGSEEALKFSADLLSYVTPSSFQSIWGSAFSPLVGQFLGGPAERTLFLGYSTLALALVALVFRRGQELFLWLGIGLLFFVLSLGPVLHVAGETALGPDQITIPLPSALLYQIPGVSGLFAVARSVGRFGVMTMLALSLLAAFGLQQLVERTRRLPARALILGACALYGLEVFVAPITTTTARIPRALDVVRNDPASFAMLDTPADFTTGGEAMYFQTALGKPTMSGYLSRQLPFPFLDGVRSMRPLLDMSDPSDIIVEPVPRAAQVLNFLNVKYVTLHKQTGTETLRDKSARWISNNLGNPTPIAEDGRIAVYQVPTAPIPPLVPALAQGWYVPDHMGDGSVWRWMQNDGRLLVYAREPQTVEIRFNALSLGQTRQLQFYWNGTLDDRESVPNDKVKQVAIRDLVLRPGQNELRLHSVEPPQQPLALGIGEDERYLSIRFSQLSVRISR